LGEGSLGELGNQSSASVVLATFGYAHLDLPSDTAGVIVPKSEGLLMTACSFSSVKWPHWAEKDRAVLRVSAGRFGDTRAIRMSDEALIDRLASEISMVLGVEAQPDSWRINRWPQSFPQYGVGHQDAVAQAFQALCRSHPRIVLCGSSYFGVGIPTCIASGRSAAMRVRRSLEGIR
jgi:oxygen-dependent protoporphyrinogen oxidase